MGLYVNLAHALVTGPCLIYLGVASAAPDLAYHLALAVAALLECYLAYVLLSGWRSSSTSKRTWLAVHLVVVIPLLAWVGWKKQAAPRVVRSLLLALGCAAVGYHVARLIQRKGR